MEFSDTFQRITNISVVCKLLKQSYSFRKQLIIQLTEDPNILEDQCTETTVDPTLLFELYQLSLYDSVIEILLYHIIDIVSPESISERLFRALISYPRESLRNRFVVALAHKQLSPAMLGELCETNLCFECYFELIMLQYNNSTYTAAELRQSIALFFDSPFVDLWPELSDILSHLTASTTQKQCVVDTFSSVWNHISS